VTSALEVIFIMRCAI